MPYYIAPYIGAGTIVDPFRPRGSNDPTWSAIDLRPDPSRLDGGGLNACLLWVFTPSSDPNLTLVATGEQETLTPNRRNLIRSRLGLTSLTATRWDQIVLEILMVPPANAWLALRPSRVRRRYEVYLGPGAPLAIQPVIAGGVSITEDFNCADSTTINCDLTWTELNGNLELFSNTVRNVGTAGNHTIRARAESALATDDHYAEITVTALELSGGNQRQFGVMTRRRSNPTHTAYWLTLVRERLGGVSGEALIIREVSGSQTLLADPNITITLPTVLRGESDGSTQRILVGGTEQASVTDTNIVNNLYCGLAGFLANANDSGDVAGDDWSAADLAAGGATWPGWFHSRGGWTA